MIDSKWRRVYLLNAPVVTDFGIYVFAPLDLACAREIAVTADHRGVFVSAIGHEPTAQLISELLDLEIKAQRIEITQQPNEIAIVFRLKSRIREGHLLSIEEIGEIGYDFGLLKKIE